MLYFTRMMNVLKHAAARAVKSPFGFLHYPRRVDASAGVRPATP
ncbi:MAG: hypothetical protein ABIR13_00750 [Polaromonas sp.]